MDWTPWRKAFGIKSAGGGYTVEYIFYVLYSVSLALVIFSHVWSDVNMNFRFYLLSAPVSWSEHTPFSRDTAEFLRSKLFLVALSSDISWAHPLSPLNLWAL